MTTHEKKIILMIIILFTSFCTSSCFNYADINRTMFVTAILIDIDSFNNPILYVENFVPSRGDTLEIGKENKSIQIAKGSSLYEAVRSLRLNSSFTINYTQCRAVIFTRKAASFGLDNFLDLFDRGQELPQRSYLFITPSDPEKLLKVQMKEEKFVGIFLSELAENMVKTPQGTAIRIDEFFNNRLLGSKVNVVNLIELKKEQIEPRMSIDGLAIIKEDKLVDELSLDQARAYNFLNNNIKHGTIYSTNPEHQDKQVALDILKSKTKTQLNFDGNIIHLKKKINTEVSVAFAEKSIHITVQQQTKALEKGGAENIKTMCKNLFSEYKEKNIDIFNLQRDFEMRYPRRKIDNCLQIAELELDVNVNIKGSTITKNFK